MKVAHDLLRGARGPQEKLAFVAIDDDPDKEFSYEASAVRKEAANIGRQTQEGYMNDDPAPEHAFEALMEHFMERQEELKAPGGAVAFDTRRCNRRLVQHTCRRALASPEDSIERATAQSALARRARGASARATYVYCCTYTCILAYYRLRQAPPPRSAACSERRLGLRMCTAVHIYVYTCTLLLEAALLPSRQLAWSVGSSCAHVHAHARACTRTYLLYLARSVGFERAMCTCSAAHAHE